MENRLVELPYNEQNALHIQSELKALFDLAETAWNLASKFMTEQDKIGVGRAILTRQKRKMNIFRFFVSKGKGLLGLD